MTGESIISPMCNMPTLLHRGTKIHSVQWGINPPPLFLDKPPP